MERFEHLEKIYSNFQGDLESIALRIKRGDPPKEEMIGLKGANMIYALKAFYIDHDVHSTKLFLYRAAKAIEYTITNHNSRLIESGVEHTSIAFLSDNPFLIERYSTITAQYPLCIGFQIVNAMQNILNGKFEELPENIRQIKRLCSTKTFKNLTPFVPVFEAFLNKDKSALVEGLMELLATHKKRITDPLIPRFLSVDTAGLCKLAWIKGYEIDLKSDLVPLELMPIKPLEHYEDDMVMKMLLNIN